MSATDRDDGDSVYFHSGWKAALSEVQLLVRSGHELPDVMTFVESQLKR